MARFLLLRYPGFALVDVVTALVLEALLAHLVVGADVFFVMLYGYD